MLLFLGFEVLAIIFLYILHGVTALLQIMLITSVITDWKVTGCQEDHAGMVPGLWFVLLHLRSQMFCCELTWGHDECKPAQDKRNGKRVMTSHYSPTFAPMMSFLLSGVSFYLLLFNPKPHLLCCSFLHILDSFRFGSQFILACF